MACETVVYLKNFQISNKQLNLKPTREQIAYYIDYLESTKHLRKDEKQNIYHQDVV